MKIIILINNSLDKKVQDDLFNHIKSLCNLLQGDNNFLEVKNEIV